MIHWLSFNDFEQRRHEQDVARAVKRSSYERKKREPILGVPDHKSTVRLIQESIATALQPLEVPVVLAEDMNPKGKQQCPNCGRMIKLVAGSLMSHRTSNGAWCLKNGALADKPLTPYFDSR